MIIEQRILLEAFVVGQGTGWTKAETCTIYIDRMSCGRVSVMFRFNNQWIVREVARRTLGHILNGRWVMRARRDWDIKLYHGPIIAQITTVHTGPLDLNYYSRTGEQSPVVEWVPITVK